MKPDGIEGSVVNGLREPILFSLFSVIFAVYKAFCEPGTIPYKKY